MINTKFWNPNKNRNSGKFSANTASTSTPKKELSKGAKKLLAGLGVTGGVILIVIGIVSILAYIYIVRPAYILINITNNIKAHTNDAKNAVIGRDLVAFEKDLFEIEQDLNDLRNAREKNFKWTKDLSFTKEYYSDSDHFINAGFYAIEAGKETINLAKPFADAAGLKVTESTESTEQPDQPTKDTGLAEAFSAWISIMPEIANNLDGLIAKMDQIGQELAQVDASKYPERLGNVEVRSVITTAQTNLTKVSDYAPDIKQALQIIPQLLAVNSTSKRYMIIMQNDKEMRATGGFWTFYATFKVQDAMLASDFTSKDMYSIDITLNAIDAYVTFPKAPDAYTNHLKVEHLYARDANTSPDFPTSIEKFMYFYKLAMPLAPAEIKPVDGVIAIDTEVIEQLLEVTGPVTVNGVTYSKDNVVLELEKIASLALRDQANRKKVLGDLMEAMLINVYESDKNLWPKLVEKGISLAVNKHAIVYVTDTTAQALLEKYNLAGRIIDPVEGDYSYIVSTNLGGDKTNWFVQKEIDHNLAQEGDRYIDTVKIKYTYTEPNADFAPFIKRFKDWVRVYTPTGSELISVDGSEDTTTQDTERNKTYFSGYVELGPNETKELTFKYYVPSSVVNNNVYKLYIQKQSGIVSEIHTVTINGKTETIDLKTDYQYTTTIK